MITQTIDLCMIPGSTNPVIHVNQYDAYPGGLIFNLYEESAFEIPAGAAVTINGTKPDKYGFSYTASYSGNVVTADLEQQMTAVAGNVECELRVSLGSETIGTQNFTLCVEEAALNNETIISDTDIPALVNAQRYASEAAASAGEAETSADAAADSATAAAGSAEAAAASAEAAAQDFSNAVKYTDIVNNGTYSGAAGEKVLDAAMGKTLTDNIDAKVSKAGDTMTGILTMQNHVQMDGNYNYYSHGTDASIDTTPSSNYWGHGFVLQDAAGADFGQIKSFHMTDGTRGVYIESKAGIGNILRLGAKGTNPYVYVGYPQAWFDAINYPVTIDTGSIDDIVAPGYYYLPINTVSDLPEGGNGILWVFAETQSNRVRQVFMRTGTPGTNDNNIYIRQSANSLSGWGTWHKYGDTEQFSTWTDITPTAGTDVNNIGSSMARYNQLTKLCCLNINIRINATSLATSTTLLSGLPKPVAAVQGLIGMSNNDNIRVKVTTTGYLQTDGAHTLTATGQYFNGNIVYPYSSLT